MVISVISAILRNKFAGVFLALALSASCVALSDLVAEAAVDFTQCRNDADNNNVANNCQWTSGGINSNNGFYAEGESVPQRLFITIDTAAGAHTIRFQYDFSRASIHAYDFLASADSGPQTGALLSPCTERPGFVTSGTCSTMFTGKTDVLIPSDPFDNVSTFETAVRNFYVGCSPSCSGLGLSFPNLDGGDVDDNTFPEAHDPDSDPDCVLTCGTSTVTIDLALTTSSSPTLVAIWFGGHLALGTGGWGAGQGASSVSGSPFHIRTLTLDGASLGNRDNQLQGGVFAATIAGSITIQKVVLGDPPASPWDFSGTLGGFQLLAAGGQQTFSLLDAGVYIISETTKDGFTASVGCSNGATGTDSVTVTLVDVGISCIFTNTAPPTGIPTLSEWGMIGMALLLAAVALWYLRSRSVLRT